jgi:pimeloyl-ACP methyl ester carboxylesterase
MSRRRRAGIFGLAAGLLAAGVATGIAAERRLVGRVRDDDHSGIPFGSLRGEGHWVKADDGLGLYAEIDRPGERARPNRPTIVLVHGYALNLDCWYFQRELLRDNYRLVLYDQRSHGRSTRSRREHCTIDQLGRDLRRVVEQLVPDGPAILVGHSMGGMSIMAFAEQCPELFGTKITGVGLISTSAGGLDLTTLGLPGAPGRLAHRAAPALIAALARMPNIIDRGRKASSDLAFAATRRLAFADENVADELVDFTDEMLSATPFEVVVDFFPGFDEHDKYAALAVLGWVPTVVICGDGDLITPPRHARRIADLVPAAQFVEVADGGHMVLLDHAVEVNQALLAMIVRAERKRRRERSRRR